MMGCVSVAEMEEQKQNLMDSIVGVRAVIGRIEQFQGV